VVRGYPDSMGNIVITIIITTIIITSIIIPDENCDDITKQDTSIV
jgi:hypothetical protein